jgi:hypothetical protein
MIGRVPKFYYIAHFYLVHLLAITSGVLQYTLSQRRKNNSSRYAIKDKSIAFYGDFKI